jgi:hypothetical protein
MPKIYLEYSKPLDDTDLDIKQAIDSNINYLTKINYRVRAHYGRPKNDVGVPVNLPSCPELRTSMITDDIHGLGVWYHVWSAWT